MMDISIVSMDFPYLFDSFRLPWIFIAIGAIGSFRCLAPRAAALGDTPPGCGHSVLWRHLPAKSCNIQQQAATYPTCTWDEPGEKHVKNMGKMNMMNDMGKHGRKKCRTSAPHLTDSKHAAGPAGLRWWTPSCEGVSVRGDPTKGEEIATHLAPSCHWKFPGNLMANLKMVYQDVSNEVWQLYEVHPLSLRPELLSPPCCCQRHSTWKWWVLGLQVALNHWPGMSLATTLWS